MPFNSLISSLSLIFSRTLFIFLFKFLASLSTPSGIFSDNRFIFFVINSISFKLARILVADTIYSCFHTAASCLICKESASIASANIVSLGWSE
ncbi:hypothetical protein RhiirA4_117895 [Rhizophagus irregularis]|uniref:Uncharacterized protein n=1 Tax=Rhizophagus irregularis TaxID=588596 RepID=A0A2I1HEZ1_9GLOM|nr:hypothetical protein RhiirA4_117895 [Rhizophagus irregularis]